MGLGHIIKRTVENSPIINITYSDHKTKYVSIRKIMLWKYYSLFIDQTQQSFKIRSPPTTGFPGVLLNSRRKTEGGIELRGR